MEFNDIKSILCTNMSKYIIRLSEKGRSGKLYSGELIKSNYVSMVFETIGELVVDDEYAPLDRESVRKLLYAFNRLTASATPDVWE